MVRFFFGFFVCFSCSFSIVNGQVPIDTTLRYKLPYEIENGDTIAVGTFDNIYIYPQPTFEKKKEEKRYWRLVYNLKVVYPYAKLANSKLREMNEHFLTLKTEHERSVYAKQVEKDIRKQFEGELTNLTITQGRLLIKLIDRETGKTSYDLVKDLRGSFSAVFWQTVARLFGSNLKTRYDAMGEDKPIEEILKAIDAGYL